MRRSVSTNIETTNTLLTCDAKDDRLMAGLYSPGLPRLIAPW